MTKILVTGGTGFIGQNLLMDLKRKYEVEAPRREDLNLKDEEAVSRYLEKERFDVVIHGAGPVRNKVDSSTNVLEESLRLFMNFYRNRSLYGKLIYFGSGAEYDKRRDLEYVTEENIGVHIPEDEYGLAKYIINTLVSQSENIYNLRLFACFGPYEHETRFITHGIGCCLLEEPITMRQDCLFDYMYISDLIKVVNWFINNDPKYHDYNVCRGIGINLSEIANFINDKMAGKGIRCEISGKSKAYTGSNQRLLRELKGFKWMDLQEGIERQIMWQRGRKDEAF